MKFNISNGYVYSKKGIPAMPRWFCDGRLAVKYGNEGVERIEYYVPEKDHGNQIIFNQGIFDCFRISIKKDGLRYSPNYKNVELSPYGFTADCIINGEVFKVGIYTLNQNLFFYANGDSEYEFRLSFHESTQYIPAFNGDFSSDDCGYKRAWKKWEDVNGVIYGGFSDVKGECNSNLDIAIVSDRENVHFVTPRNCRQDVSVNGCGEKFIGVIFANKDIKEKVIENKDFFLLLKKQQARYNLVAKNAPNLTTGNKGVDTFFALAPMFYESLKTVDVKGAIRAKSARYYVWGWDTIMSNLPRYCWRDYEHVNNILDFFMQRFDSENGMLHACNFDNTVASYAHLASQGVYVNLLEHYVTTTNDIVALEKYYPTAKKIFENVIAKESKIKGLFTSSSLSTDFIECVKENGNDISSFNNSIAYAMTRAIETLSAMVGDKTTQSLARKIANNTEKNFIPTFFDDEKGYLFMSVDAETLEKRKVFALCITYLWDSDYHFDLLGLHAPKCKNFIKKHAFSKFALRDVPVWEDCFDMDANQLNSTFPNVDEVLLQLCRLNGLDKGIKIWLKKLEFWMNKLTCPEGESYLYESNVPYASRWDGENGTWQGFAVRKWYTDILEVILGLSIDGGGLTISEPYLPYQLNNLVVCGKEFSIKTQGEGKFVNKIIVNGKELLGCKKIPFDLLNDVNEIIVVLGGEQAVVIERFTGAKIENYICTSKNKITFNASTYGTKGLFVKGNVSILQDNKSVETTYLKRENKTYAKVSFSSNKNHEFTINYK